MLAVPARTRCVLAILACLWACTTANAGPSALRVPQVPFAAARLQTMFDHDFPGLDAQTQQLAAQKYVGSEDPAPRLFDLLVDLELSDDLDPPPQDTEVGLYSTSSGALVMVPLLPRGFLSSCYVECRFGSTGVFVDLYDWQVGFLGRTYYPGIARNDFSFYVSGPFGTWFQEDARNGGHPQALFYEYPLPQHCYGRELNVCFELAPYDAATSTFDAIVVHTLTNRDPDCDMPVPTRPTTWGHLKALYR